MSDKKDQSQEEIQEVLRSEQMQANVEKAFAATRRSNVVNYKPASKERLLGARSKKEDIVVPMDLYGDGEIEHITFRHPTNLDHALAGGNLFKDYINKDGNIDADNTDPVILEKMEQYQRAFIQRIIKDPYFSLEEINELDYDTILEMFMGVDSVVKGEEADAASFRTVGDGESRTDDTA